MVSRRSLTFFATAFVTTILASVAFAQVGAFTPDAPDPDELAVSASAAYTADAIDGLDGDTVPLSQFEDPGAEEQANDTTTPGSFATRGPATLVILHPVDGQRFDQERVRFSGVAPIGWMVTAADYRATVDGEGNWYIDLLLWPGANPAKIVATGPDGQVQTAVVTAIYDVPEVDAPPATNPPDDQRDPDPGEDVLFTAAQRYGKSTDQNPTEVFGGTAPPGSTIYALSDYGSATTVADARGRWSIRLTFTDPPVDQPFSIVLEADTGQRLVFEFIRVAPSDENGNGERRRPGSDDPPPRDDRSRRDPPPRRQP